MRHEACLSLNLPYINSLVDVYTRPSARETPPRSACSSRTMTLTVLEDDCFPRNFVSLPPTLPWR